MLARLQNHLAGACDRLGGQLYLAAAPPGREEFAELAKDLARQVALSDIKVVLNKNVDETSIENEKPDIIILAKPMRNLPRS